MTEEGEFERLIRLHEGNGLVIHSRLIEDWLKRAKKEFPHPEPNQSMWVLSNKRGEWFRKWFGEP